MSLLEDKINMMSCLYKAHGDYSVATMYRTRTGGFFCSKRVAYSELRLNPELLKNMNVRTMVKAELVLDFESPEEAEEGCRKADKDEVTFTVWDTGSRGVHVHAFYRELEEYTEQYRQAIRLELIKRYGADPAKKSGLIALEYAPHFKTDKPKVKKKVVAHEENFLRYDTRKAVEKQIIRPINMVWDKNNYIWKLYRKISVQDIFGALPGFKKVGRNYLMLCPFHEDTHPSLSVPDDKPVFHCFGCGAKGDWLKFIMMYEGVRFRDAKRRLEDLANEVEEAEVRRRFEDVLHEEGDER